VTRHRGQAAEAMEADDSVGPGHAPGELKHGVCRLTRYWTLTPDDPVLVMAKRRANRLGFAILLVFFRDRGQTTG
jgi:hypothetical protein